jgi:hypothetical protein
VSKALRVALACVAACAACARQDPAAAEAELMALREEVRSLADSAALRQEGIESSDTDTVSTIAIALRVETLREILSFAAASYLDDVRLHLNLDVVVRAGDEVRVQVGPANVRAGRWDLAVTVQRVDALLRAGRIEVAVGDSNRLDITVPVLVREARGHAMIDFTWDAARLASVACSDFAVSEPFHGFVRPHTQRLRGYFLVVAENGRMVARPVLRDNVFVSPQPTDESWERVREILRDQNQIFRCGLALSPDRMEQMLRDLLTQGFRFRLPASLLRPIPLPGSFIDEIEVAGRRATVRVTPEFPRLTDDRLWLRAAVRASALDDDPIRMDGG